MMKIKKKVMRTNSNLVILTFSLLSCLALRTKYKDKHLQDYNLSIVHILRNLLDLFFQNPNSTSTVVDTKMTLPPPHVNYTTHSGH